MAREEKGDGDAGYEFQMPDFDEDAFIHREMVSFKATATLFVWGIVAAAASWAAFAAVAGRTESGWPLGLAICLAFGLALKLLFKRLGIDIAHYKRREWTGTGFLFFFTWLSFFILAVNPPVSDFSAPQVELSANPPVQVVNGTVSLAILVTDNVHVATRSVTVTRDGAAVPAAETGRSGDLVWYNLTGLPAGTYAVQALGSDARGHTTVGMTNVTVGPQDFRIDLPPGGVLDATTRVVVHLPGLPVWPGCDDAQTAQGRCLRTVRLVAEDGRRVDMGRVEGQAGDWEASANYAQWKHAGPAAFRVEAEFMNHYEGAHPVPGGTVRLEGPYHVNVTANPGSYATSVPDTIGQRQVHIPGLGLPTLALAVLGLAAVAARRWRN